MMKKAVLLFLALLLPVSIFLFLHFFGQNEFEIPIYYTSPTKDIPTECIVQYNFPYKVSGSSVLLSGPSVVFFVSGLSGEYLNESNFQLERLSDEFETNAPKLIRIMNETDNLPSLPESITLDSASYFREKNCIFLAGTNQMVLVDGEKQIRGLYPNTSLKEVDRLILELKILYKTY